MTSTPTDDDHNFEFVSPAEFPNFDDVDSTAVPIPDDSFDPSLPDTEED